MSDPPIREWFKTWRREHIEATGWTGWPMGATDEVRAFYRRFRDAMESAGFTHALAIAATNALRGRKDPGRDAYLDAVLEFVAPIRKAERDAEHARTVARRKELGARWDAMTPEEQAPIRERVLEAHPYWRTAPGMLRRFCADSLEDSTIAGPAPPPSLRLVGIDSKRGNREPSARPNVPPCKPMTANG